jgi:hypothetical protein
MNYINLESLIFDLIPLETYTNLVDIWSLGLVLLQMLFLLDFRLLADLMQESKIVGGTIENRKFRAKTFYQDIIKPMIIRKFSSKDSNEFEILLSQMLVLQRSPASILLKLDSVKKWIALKKNCISFHIFFCLQLLYVFY